ncbi:hypothetical protein QBA75_38325 [Streptomyces stelliscabiei]
MATLRPPYRLSVHDAHHDAPAPAVNPAAQAIRVLLWGRSW